MTTNLAYEKTSRTSKFQHYIIRLEYGWLSFCAPIEDDDIKAEKLLKYLNDNNIKSFKDVTPEMGCKFVIASIEFKTGR